MVYFSSLLLLGFRRKFSDSDHHAPSRAGRTKQQPVHSESAPMNKRAREDYTSTTTRQVEKQKTRKVGGGDTGDESQASETAFPR